MTTALTNCSQKTHSTKNILLADDDIDDCSFFKDALDGLQQDTCLTTVTDGEQLMNLLHTNEPLPDIIFLDINMPRKNGFECLLEIKRHNKLKELPIIIFTTTFEQGVVDRLYRSGAHYFICKPPSFSHFKEVIQQALTLIEREKTAQPLKEHFVLKVDKRPGFLQAN
ncbi:MAG: response regulator [Flavisolibacter sp.]|jgi:CheY-like chemotaxis protein|nr:response regulator [Flavisolibacter sp.]